MPPVPKKMLAWSPWLHRPGGRSCCASTRRMSRRCALLGKQHDDGHVATGEEQHDAVGNRDSGRRDTGRPSAHRQPGEGLDDHESTRPSSTAEPP